MLLNEIKILREVDRDPLAGALNTLGVNFGRGDRSTDTVADLDPSLAPLVREYILTNNPGKMSESSLKSFLDKAQLKADSAEEKYEIAYNSLAGMRTIIRRLQNRFEDEVLEEPGFEKLAKADTTLKAKTGAEWLAHWRKMADVTAQSEHVTIARMIDQGKQTLDDALMKVSVAESWATQQANKFKKHLRQVEAGIKDGEDARQEIRLTYAVFKTLEDNLTQVLKMIEPLKRPKS